MIASGFRRPAAKAPAAPAIDTSVQQSRAMLEAALDEAASGEAITDAAGGVVRANRTLRDWLAGAPTDTAAWALFAAADQTRVEAAIRSALEEPRCASASGARPFAARLGPADQLRCVTVSATALRDPDGRVSGAAMHLHDASREDSLERQLDHAQRLHLAGQLASGFAHDFNNLLTAIIGATDVVAAAEGLDTLARDDLASIRASADRGAALVRRMLSLGGQPALAPRPLDLDTAIAALCSVLRRVLPSSVRLKLALHAPGARVRIDPTALDQVLLNLSVNARDAMPAGGTLTLGTGVLNLREPSLRHGGTIPTGNYARIAVADTGAGIAPEVRARMFEPFFTTRRAEGGSGLGLATVQGIVARSGGFIAVDSERGAGTRFDIYLPVCTESAAATLPLAAYTGPDRRAGPRPGAERGTILLVDDEEAVLRITERALRANGWLVLAAACAEDALELLSETPSANPSVVVTDLMMPGMTGAELVGALRRRGDMPAVLVSGYAAEQVMSEAAATLGEQARDHRTTRLLAKPYDIRELTAQLDALLPPAGAERQVASTPSR